MDEGILSLALALRLHQIPVDASRLQHEFSRGGRSCDSQDLIRAAGRLGCRAKLGQLDPARIDPRILPAIAATREGGFLVLARLHEEPGGERRFLVQQPRSAPETLDATTLGNRCNGELILLRPRADAAGHSAAAFGLRWFVPALARYRHVFGEVLLASFFLQLFALVTPLFFQVVMDKVLVHRGFSTLNVLAVGFAVVVLFDAVVGALRNYLFSHTTHRVDVELGARLFRHLTALPLAYFEARPTGHTVARVRELETIRDFITGSTLTLLVDIAFTVVFIAVLWHYSPTLTWIVLGALPFYVALSVAVTPVLRRRLERRFHAGARQQAFLTETVAGIETVKSQALEPRLQRRWEDQLADYVAAAFGAQNLGNIAGQCAGLIGKIVTLLIVWRGAHLVIDGALTVGQLVAFNMIAGRVTGPILKLVQLWQDFQQAGISLARLGDILNTPVEPGALGQRSTPARVAGGVRFEQVRFRYQPDAAPVLEGLDLDIAPGEALGIVGRSGSGKSTLAKLLQRLHAPESGRILLDGVDLAGVDAAWLRRNVGVVQQESFLFDRTVRENIALADPGRPFEHVERCARVAGAHEFILQLPQGYDTQIGEQGCTLSGGQRQRLAIARALLCDPRVLIMDEATSALDYESECVIHRHMNTICEGRTVMVIAHRLSTVRHCDRIVVLDRGHIAESGTHEELMRADGYYARLYRYQNHAPPIRQPGASSAISPGRAGGAQPQPDRA